MWPSLSVKSVMATKKGTRLMVRHLLLQFEGATGAASHKEMVSTKW